MKEVRFTDKLKDMVISGCAMALTTIMLTVPSISMGSTNSDTELTSVQSEGLSNSRIKSASDMPTDAGIAFQNYNGIHIYEEAGYKYKLLEMDDIGREKSSLEFYGKHQEAIDAYDNIIYEIANLFHETNFSNPAEYLGAFCYFLYNGYFSNNNYYEYSLDIIDYEELITEYLGLQIIDSRGVCRNEASMLTDVFKKMGIKAFTVSSINMDSEKPSISYDENKSYIRLPKIKSGPNSSETSISDSEFNYDIFPSDVAAAMYRDATNHATCLVYFDGKVYNLDPTNALISKVTKEDDTYFSEVISGSIRFKIKLISSYSQNYISLDELKELSDILETADLSQQDYFWDDFANGVVWCMENDDKVKEFRKLIEDSIVVCSSYSDYVDCNLTEEIREENSEKLRLKFEDAIQTLQLGNDGTSLPSNEPIEKNQSQVPFGAFAVYSIMKQKRKENTNVEVASKKAETKKAIRN